MPELLTKIDHKASWKIKKRKKKGIKKTRKWQHESFNYSVKTNNGNKLDHWNIKYKNCLLKSHRSLDTNLKTHPVSQKCLKISPFKSHPKIIALFHIW